MSSRKSYNRDLNWRHNLVPRFYEIKKYLADSLSGSTKSTLVYFKDTGQIQAVIDKHEINYYTSTGTVVVQNRNGSRKCLYGAGIEAFYNELDSIIIKNSVQFNTPETMVYYMGGHTNQEEVIQKSVISKLKAKPLCDRLSMAFNIIFKTKD